TVASAALTPAGRLAARARHDADPALLPLARAETAPIPRTPSEPLRIHEAPPGTARPSFERLDKLVQIVTADGEPLARSATLGTARLPLSERARTSLGRGRTIYETVENFGDEPIRMITVPLRVGAAHYAVQVARAPDAV